MADRDKMSVAEILAACRRQDGGAGEPSSSPATESARSEAPGEKAASVEPAGSETAATPPPPASGGTSATGGKKPSEMSVAEMLAAARAEKSAAKPAAPPAEKAAGKPAAGKPAAGKPAAGGAAKKPGQMSVAEMLAAARAEKAGGATPTAQKPAAQKPAAQKPAAQKPAAQKPAAAAAKPAATKPAAAKAAGPKAAGPKDTTSILAAARSTARPGPLSKAEAAARAAKTQPAPPPKAKAKLEVPPRPEKPMYARAPVPPAEQESRRGFFTALAGVFVGSSLAVGFSSLAVTHLLWLLGLARFMFPNVLIEPPTRFTVGFPDELAPGQVETRYIPQFGVWVVRYEFDGQPQIFALQAICTHLGCTPNWLEGEQKFKCPCHGSGFYKDGINFEGPAPRPLERYAIRIADDGQLEVDKSRTFKQEMGQWNDAASFVPV